MKNIIVFSFIIISVTAHPYTGSEGVGGGDLCENRIKIIRDDLNEWIMQSGPKGLTLPANISVGQYSKTMLRQMGQAKIKCVSEGDAGYPVNINGVAKVCKFDATQAISQIICDYNKFQSISESDQYILVHHEFAGLANIEIPNGADSNYFVSNQISGYLVNQVVKKLSIKPVISNNAIVLDCNLQSTGGLMRMPDIQGKFVIDFDQGTITNETNGDFFAIWNGTDREAGQTEGIHNGPYKNSEGYYADGGFIKIDNSSGYTVLNNKEQQYWVGSCKRSPGI